MNIKKGNAKFCTGVETLICLSVKVQRDYGPDNEAGLFPRQSESVRARRREAVILPDNTPVL